jgi:hypothetical protein
MEPRGDGEEAARKAAPGLKRQRAQIWSAQSRRGRVGWPPARGGGFLQRRQRPPVVPDRVVMGNVPPNQRVRRFCRSAVNPLVRAFMAAECAQGSLAKEPAGTWPGTGINQLWRNPNVSRAASETRQPVSGVRWRRGPQQRAWPWAPEPRNRDEHARTR